MKNIRKVICLDCNHKFEGYGNCPKCQSANVDLLDIKLQKGEIYQVNHSRKGVFNLLVVNQGSDFVTGIIVKGKAMAMLKYNERKQSDSITIRKSLCEFHIVN